MTLPLHKFVQRTFVLIQVLLPCQFGSYLVLQGTSGACKKFQRGPTETLLYFIVCGALFYSTVLNATWPTPVAIFLNLAHNSNRLVDFLWTLALTTLAGAAASISLVRPSTPNFFDMVCIGSICKTFYFLITFIVWIHIYTTHLNMIFRVLYTLLAPYRLAEIWYGAMVPFTKVSCLVLMLNLLVLL